ncbi:MAG: hypothetical protein SWO11_22050 [Thermodesulfobacteriota bacterium]|nr:hypothetical protein [Thermodesulfobacteriota bacterium]
MKIYSGSCCLCDVGLPANQKDIHGNDLFSGDIVMLWHGSYLGTDIEEWLPSDGLTAIVGNQYQSYSNGTVKLLTNKPSLFTMGISDCGIQNDEWKVSLVKSHKDIIPGERFIAYGFNYKL